MAWIKVTEQFKEHRKLRDLARLLAVSRHEAAGLLVFLWIWGINNADREGNLTNTSESDIALAVMSAGLSVGLSAIQLVDCLVKSEWIDKNDTGYAIHDWDIWQGEWYKNLDRCKADAERKRVERSNQKTAMCPSDSPQDNPRKIQRMSGTSASASASTYIIAHKQKKLDDVGSIFEQMWAAYPRRLGKSKVKPAQKTKLAAVGLDAMMGAIEHYKQFMDGKDEQFVMYGSSWFNGGYTDHLGDNIADQASQSSRYREVE